MENKTEGVYTPLFLYYNQLKSNLMNKAKLKVLVMALKEIVEELESEVYSDVDAYKNMEVSVSKQLDYDEMYDDGSD